MKLVFITRKIDRSDPLTGFVFGWLNQLASKLEKLYVICQEKGDTSGLAKNIEVYSFGKEKGYGKLRQGFALFALSFKFAKKSNGFFVHMHPIYAIISLIPAKLFGKKIALWYVHKSVDTKLKIAHALVDRVFTASKESFRLPSSRVKIVGHGIDLEKFRPLPASGHPPQAWGGAGGEVEGKFRIVSIGRISPVKDYETLIKAVEILVNEQGIKDIEVEIYGKIGLPKHQSYLDLLIKFIENAELDDYIDFQGELSYDYVDEVLLEADLFANMSGTGSLDKAVLEAAAAGKLVITSNEAFKEPLEKISPLLYFRRDKPQELANKILQLKNLDTNGRIEIQKKLRDWVEEDHNLEELAKKIITEFK